MSNQKSWKMKKPLRLGEVLIEQGLLTESQVKAILTEQRETNRPFGVIAESLCSISMEAIEDAWASQYAQNTRTVDPFVEIPRTEAKEMITTRQAWQFRCLPMSLEGDTLVIATTPKYLRRALKFATSVLDRQAYFVMTTDNRLAAALSEHYPIGGMGTSSVTGDSINRLVTKMRLDRLRESA
jgi:MSHA biogenesis protein MshE